MVYELVLFTGVVEEEPTPTEEQARKTDKKKKKLRSKIAAVKHKTAEKRNTIAEIAAKIQQMDAELQAEHEDLAKRYSTAQEELARIQKEIEAAEKAKSDAEVIIDEEGDDPLNGFDEVNLELDEDLQAPSKNREQRRKEEQEEKSAKRAKDIKDLWRKIAMRTHPDRPESTSEKVELYKRAKSAYESKNLETLESIWRELTLTASSLLKDLLDQLNESEMEYMMTTAMLANLKNSEQFNMMSDWFAGFKYNVSAHFRKASQVRLDQMLKEIDKLRPRHTVNQEDTNEFKATTSWHFEA